MVTYYDRFRGHLEPEDPRRPLTAAGGCTWPTIPPHRYYASSENATGFLLPLNTQGILLEKVTPGLAHDACQWLMIAGPIPITFGILWKRYYREREEVDWYLGISASPCGLIDIEWTTPIQSCNRAHLLGDHCCPLLPGSCTGDTFTLWQVEYDKTEPTSQPPP